MCIRDSAYSICITTFFIDNNIMTVSEAIKMGIFVKSFWWACNTSKPSKVKNLHSMTTTIYIAYNKCVVFVNLYVSPCTCLLYTSDAADDLLCVDLGGGLIINKKN
eukprot:TRINITY_DN19171_c0_g1_i1.p1 TRINITY_DN19171_c0_g1~~TRINITY_DN19171_c0_g1_i1.p1  ORF type:complete len:106 (-),score=24.22 TRINITY_DN19171_c0_g1_i1:51-368(-)